MNCSMFTGNGEIGRRLEKKGTYRKKKYNLLGNSTPWWQTQNGYKKGGEDGIIGARAPVNGGWKVRPWLCRRGRLEGRWWFGFG